MNLGSYHPQAAARTKCAAHEAELAAEREQCAAHAAAAAAARAELAAAQARHVTASAGGGAPWSQAEAAAVQRLPLYSDRIIDRMTVFLCILYQRLHVGLDGHFCAVHAMSDMLRRVCPTYLCLCYARAGTGG